MNRKHIESSFIRTSDLYLLEPNTKQRVVAEVNTAHSCHASTVHTQSKRGAGDTLPRFQSHYFVYRMILRQALSDFVSLQLLVV